MSLNIVEIVRTETGCIKKRSLYPDHVVVMGRAMGVYAQKCLAVKNWRNSSRFHFHVLSVDLNSSNDRSKFIQYLTSQMPKVAHPLYFSSIKGGEAGGVSSYLDSSLKDELFMKLKQNKCAVSVVFETREAYEKAEKWLSNRFLYADAFHDVINVKHKRGLHTPVQMLSC